MTRIARPSSPQPKLTPPLKPVTLPAHTKPALVHRFRDELSTGKGLALRAAFQPPSRAASSSSALPVRDILVLVGQDGFDADDALLIARGTLPLDRTQLEELGIDPNHELTDAERNALVAEAFRQAPEAFLLPAYTTELTAAGREEAIKAVADAVASGALTPAEAMQAVDGLKPEGPVLLINGLMTTDGVPDSVKARIAEEMWKSGDPDQKAAAALYFTSTPALIAKYLPTPGAQVEALTELTRLVSTNALESIGVDVPGLYEQVHAQAVTGAFTLFDNLKPAAMELLLNDEAKGRDLGVLEAFFERVVFDPSSKEILEDHGYSDEEIQAGVEDTVSGFVDRAYNLGVTQGGEGFDGSSTAVGVMVGRLFGLMEKAAGDLISSEAANQSSTFENFAKDLVVRSVAATVGALASGPFVSVAAPLVISAGGSVIRIDTSASRSEIEAQIQEQLGAVRLDAGESLFGAYANVLGEVREGARGTDLDDPLDEYYDGILTGVLEASD